MTIFDKVETFRYWDPPVTPNPLKNGVPQDKFLGSFQKIVIYDPMILKWATNKVKQNLQIRPFSMS